MRVLACYGNAATRRHMSQGGTCHTELINTIRYVGIHYLGQGWANGCLQGRTHWVRLALGSLYVASYDPWPTVETFERASTRWCQRYVTTYSQLVSRPVCLGVRHLSGTHDQITFTFRRASPAKSLPGTSSARLMTIFYCL
jgi:hypothetical protein